MLEFEQLKLRLEGNEGELRDLKDALGYEHLKNEIEELEAKTAAPGFWDDAENSQKILQKTGKLKNTVETYEKLCSSYEDLLTLIEMGDEEEDLSLVGEITESLEEFEKGLAAQRLQTLLTGEYDNNNAILTFHAGAGGTEAMKEKSSIAEYFVIATGSVINHNQAICDEVEFQLKKNDMDCFGTEGYKDGNWILLDCGEVIVHIMTKDYRSYYNLERLWA